MASKELTTSAEASYKTCENRKTQLACEVWIQKDQLVRLSVQALNSDQTFYKGLSISVTSDFKPVDAINVPLTEERVKQQILKTANTPFEFISIQIHLDPGLYLPKISILNELRRTALTNLEAQVCAVHQRVAPKYDLPKVAKKNTKKEATDKHISALLYLLNPEVDYAKLEGINAFYIPLKYYANKKFEKVLQTLAEKGKLYILLPTIIKSNYKNLLLNQLDRIIQTFPIQGFVLSNLSNIECFKEYAKKYEFITNYTFNVFNHQTIEQLKNLGIKKITLSPELSKEHLNELTENADIPTEVMAYGRLPLMNANYCVLGKTNRCYPTCQMRCQENKQYFLEDRMHLKFPVLPDNMQTVTTIFNSKITFLDSNQLSTNHIRMDFLEESIEEIQEAVDLMRQGKRKSGDTYTNGNFAREV